MTKSSPDPRGTAERGRYVDFQGTPVEGGRLRKLAANFGVWASVGTAALGVNLVGDHRQMQAGAVVGGAISIGVAAAFRRRASTAARRCFGPDALIDTKPSRHAATQPADLAMIDRLTRMHNRHILKPTIGATVANVAGLYLATGNVFPLYTAGLLADEMRRQYVFNKVKTGDWVIVRDHEIRQGRAEKSERLPVLAELSMHPTLQPIPIRPEVRR